MTVKVLFVCLGNICRSPTAEGVFRHLLQQEAPQLQVEIDSAGTAGYHIGDSPDLRSQRAALRRGIDLSTLRARQIEPADFADFDLILAMDQANLLELEGMRPAHSRAEQPRFEPLGGSDEQQSRQVVRNRDVRKRGPIPDQGGKVSRSDPNQCEEPSRYCGHGVAA